MLQNLELNVHVILFLQMFGFVAVPAYLSVVEMSSYAINGRGKECIKTFISMVSAIRDQKQTAFILL